MLHKPLSILVKHTYNDIVVVYFVNYRNELMPVVLRKSEAVRRIDVIAVVLYYDVCKI